MAKTFVIEAHWPVTYHVKQEIKADSLEDAKRRALASLTIWDRNNYNILAEIPAEPARDAAPELLAALRFAEPYIAEWIEQFDPSDEADADIKAAREECRQGYAHLRAAIAKAEGQPEERSVIDQMKDDGWRVHHDIHGWYVVDPCEAEPEDGTSLGFDGRTHYARESDAWEATERLLKINGLLSKAEVR